MGSLNGGHSYVGAANDLTVALQVRDFLRRNGFGAKLQVDVRMCVSIRGDARDVDSSVAEDNPGRNIEFLGGLVNWIDNGLWHGKFREGPGVALLNPTGLETEDE